MSNRLADLRAQNAALDDLLKAMDECDKAKKNETLTSAMVNRYNYLMDYYCTILERRADEHRSEYSSPYSLTPD